ncbi:Endolytic murein transglycosylase [Polaribacter huanghezhanensis]|uniref:endolytic transglycosylase MltG n=1 Tax=Polaribacter huanghezhanensis TaxID=1354726 RepID=UPI002649A789|nr:endolytic transglycosylase MltG [Polaribacter huanghezhanensis]WKD87054.1 Endolytic murein transglycosylase [Polaribacter huanghezhanensis]
MNKKKLILLIISLLLITGGILIYNTYNKIYAVNTIKEGFVFIKTNSSLKDLEKEIAPFLKDTEHFNWVANKKKYTEKIRAGKFKIPKGISNNDLINLLRSGKQTPVQLIFNNQHSLEGLAGRVAIQIEADSISILNAMKDGPFLKEHQFTLKSALGMYVPNSYEFYWNTTAEQFRDRMLTEYNRFWDGQRDFQAKKLNLSRTKVIALASIVQKETAKISERPIVAGLYLNRIKRGWPLQADPTVIYALKEKYGEDFIVKRVLLKDLTINSHYNTYINKGIPPTLIAMPDISSIDAVLFSKKHNYYYMCASVDNIGFHEFANSLNQHNRNARKYQRWMNQQGINR